MCSDIKNRRAFNRHYAFQCSQLVWVSLPCRMSLQIIFIDCAASNQSIKSFIGEIALLLHCLTRFRRFGFDWKYIFTGNCCDSNCKHNHFTAEFIHRRFTVGTFNLNQFLPSSTLADDEAPNCFSNFSLSLSLNIGDRAHSYSRHSSLTFNTQLK